MYSGYTHIGARHFEAVAEQTDTSKEIVGIGKEQRVEDGRRELDVAIVTGASKIS